MTRDSVKGTNWKTKCAWLTKKSIKGLKTEIYLHDT